jgi:transcriptional regulator GlxA family with amidase domain
MTKEPRPITALIVAIPETAGSALYGMFDVLGAAGNMWQSLVRTEPERTLIEPAIISTSKRPFRCGNGIPVAPALSISEIQRAGIIVVPEVWLGPDEHMHGRHPNLMAWLRDQYRKGASIYSACAGAIVLAEAGLLDGLNATSHWIYGDVFRQCYPKVRFSPEPALVIADNAGRLVTAGGTTSWHDLAIHLIAKHCGTGEAMRIAKVFLLKRHDEGQMPYASLVRAIPHADSVVRGCEKWLAENFRRHNCVSALVSQASVPERTLKRRFKAATGQSLIEYVQGLRIEEAKRSLETTDMPVDDIASDVGYDEPAFFRRLFKRLVGVSPGQYRRMFKPILAT